MGSRRVMPADHPSNKNKGHLPHRLLVHLYLRTRVSTMVKIIDLRIQRVVWRKGVVSVQPAPSVVETTPEFFVRDPIFVSCTIKTGHFTRECPKNNKGSGNKGNRDHSS